MNFWSAWFNPYLVRIGFLVEICEGLDFCIWVDIEVQRNYEVWTIDCEKKSWSGRPLSRFEALRSEARWPHVSRTGRPSWKLDNNVLKWVISRATLNCPSTLTSGPYRTSLPSQLSYKSWGPLRGSVYSTCFTLSTCLAHRKNIILETDY